jgi:hypothetical protein
MPDPIQPLAYVTTGQQTGGLIPCPTDRFAEFISGLLGESQVIKGTFRSRFDTGISDIENFFHLIQQRVAEQNRGVLVRFTAEIKYDDGSSIDLDSIESLKQYTEIRPLISVGVTLA